MVTGPSERIPIPPLKGHIVSRPSPTTLHACPTPTFLSRWMRRMKEGTVWECGECSSQWELHLDYGGDAEGFWRWLPALGYTFTISTGGGMVLDPDDPGPIRTNH